MSSANTGDAGVGTEKKKRSIIGSISSYGKNIKLKVSGAFSPKEDGVERIFRETYNIIGTHEEVIVAPKEVVEENLVKKRSGEDVEKVISEVYGANPEPIVEEVQTYTMNFNATPTSDTEVVKIGHTDSIGEFDLSNDVVESEIQAESTDLFPDLEGKKKPSITLDNFADNSELTEIRDDDEFIIHQEFMDDHVEFEDAKASDIGIHDFHSDDMDVFIDESEYNSSVAEALVSEVPVEAPIEVPMEIPAVEEPVVEEVQATAPVFEEIVFEDFIEAESVEETVVEMEAPVEAPITVVETEPVIEAVIETPVAEAPIEAIEEVVDAQAVSEEISAIPSVILLSSDDGIFATESSIEDVVVEAPIEVPVFEEIVTEAPIEVVEEQIVAEVAVEEPVTDLTPSIVEEVVEATVEEVPVEAPVQAEPAVSEIIAELPAAEPIIALGPAVVEEVVVEESVIELGPAIVEEVVAEIAVEAPVIELGPVAEETMVAVDAPVLDFQEIISEPEVVEIVEEEPIPRMLIPGVTFSFLHHNTSPTLSMGGVMFNFWSKSQ